MDRAISAAARLSEHDREMLEQGALSSEKEVLPLDGIRRRAHPDTRGIRADKAVEFAESITALGLLQPPVVDERNRLVAGAHRLTALRLLAVPDGSERYEFARELLDLDVDRMKDLELLERIADLDGTAFPRLFSEGVPVHRYPIDSETDPAGAMAAEVAENEKRIDYRRDEIISMYERLRKAGFVDKPGRPKKGKQAAKVVLAHILGKSHRTIEKYVQEGRNGGEKKEPAITLNVVERQGKRLLRSLKDWQLKLVALEEAEEISQNKAKEWRSAVRRALTIRDPEEIEQ